MYFAAGKILTYHSASYHEDDNSSVSTGSLFSVSVVSSMMNTVVAGNGMSRERDVINIGDQIKFMKNTRAFSSSRLAQALTALFGLGLMVMGGLSWFTTDANIKYTNQLQTTVRKSKANTQFSSLANDIILTQHLLDADAAAEQSSQVAVWEPYLELSGESGTNILVENSMAIISHCFSRPIFKLQIDESTSAYELHQIDVENSSSTIVTKQQKSLSASDVPMVVFTPNFKKAAMELFDHFHQGALITILYDPIDVYLEHYTMQKVGDDSEIDGNIVVRHLAGIEDEDRDITNADFDTAREVLKSKFIIGTCDEPSETLRRLVKMLGSTGHGTVGGEICTKERTAWNHECRRIKDIGERNRENKENQELLRTIQSKHHYDIRLYEESKKLFDEQSVLFEFQ